jgi:ketosteroid isomerase-like protein
MSNHPNFDRAEAALDAIRQGDYAPSFDLYADDIAWENGPGAGRASGPGLDRRPRRRALSRIREH